jgi:hypothetical protein
LNIFNPIIVIIIKCLFFKDILSESVVHLEKTEDKLFI